MLDVRYITCPHLEANEGGWAAAMSNDGMVVFLDSERTQMLILCYICSALVKEDIFSSLIEKSVKDSFRRTRYG